MLFGITPWFPCFGGFHSGRVWLALCVMLFQLSIHILVFFLSCIVFGPLANKSVIYFNRRQCCFVCY